MAVRPKYGKTTYQGKTFDNYTVSSLKQAITLYYILGGTGKVYVAQGSYNRGVEQSGNTHDGGGAADLTLEKPTTKNWSTLRKAMRMCMFADWDRPPIKGLWNHHNHSIQIGNDKASPNAKKQVGYYYAGQTGLADHKLEPYSVWRPNVIFKPLYPLRNVNLKNIQGEWKKKSGWKKLAGVKKMQRALNLKFGTNLKTDGIFGPQTKKAYKQWEYAVGAPAPDGKPGLYSLAILGAGRFNVN